jgi:hypothetical protein
MTTRKQKQIAYNERVSQAEDEISGINCDIADLLSGLNATESITIAINAGESMKRGEAIIGGQYWQQERRSMTAVNGVLDGMPNTRTSAILSAAVEAVTWKHPIEVATPDGKRQSSRIIFYPADRPLLEEEMSEFLKNPSDLEEGKHIAYSLIAEKCADFETSPQFYRSDSDFAQSDPILASSVPHILSTAAQVSVGSRNFVLEEGPDIVNSSDEDSPEEEHGEKLEGMYTSGLKAPVVLSQSDVAPQRAAAEQLKAIGWGKWIDSDAPDLTSTTSDWSQTAPSSPTQTRCASRFDDPDSLKGQVIPRAKTATREGSSKPTVSTAVSMPPPPKSSQRPQTFLSDSSGPSGDEMPPLATLISSRVVPAEEVSARSTVPKASTSSGTSASDASPSSATSVARPKRKAVANPAAAPPKKGAGKKASVRTADSEATHPMVTRDASRAGRLRGVGGSGQTDTCVASSHPSQT